jgi:catechol 2,3-dioxygenase-like lactoylglutathione lyase family enzyme
LAESNPPIAKVSTVFVPVSNQDEALKFYTEKLGFEIRTDAAYEENQRWLEVSPPGAETTIALVPPQCLLRLGRQNVQRPALRDALELVLAPLRKPQARASN